MIIRYAYLSLLLIMLILVSCRKKETELPKPFNPKDQTKRMAGSHKLVGTYEYECWLCNPHEHTVEPYTWSINIVVIDDSTIAFGSATGKTFSYDGYDTVNNRLYFDSDAFGSSIFEAEGLSYYYLKDSITYGQMYRTSGNRRTYKLHTE